MHNQKTEHFAIQENTKNTRYLFTQIQLVKLLLLCQFRNMNYY